MRVPKLSYNADFTSTNEIMLICHELRVDNDLGSWWKINVGYVPVAIVIAGAA